MWFVDNIVSYCNSASSYFYEIYLKVNGWVWPFWEAAWLFYGLSTTFSSLAWQFYSLGQWVDSVDWDITQILGWDTIKNYILSWFYYLGDLGTVFYYFWNNVTNVVTNWWNDISLLVQSWYKAADQLLQQGIDNLTSLWSNLQAAWDAFKDKIPSIDEALSWLADRVGNILAIVINWGALTALEINTLIDSIIRAYAPFWEGWQDVKGSVIEFIQDPWQWLYDRAEDLFDRFW